MGRQATGLLGITVYEHDVKVCSGGKHYICGIVKECNLT